MSQNPSVHERHENHEMWSQQMRFHFVSFVIFVDKLFRKLK
jgi:hypothetical protein